MLSGTVIARCSGISIVREMPESMRCRFFTVSNARAHARGSRFIYLICNGAFAWLANAEARGRLIPLRNDEFGKLALTGGDIAVGEALALEKAPGESGRIRGITATRQNLGIG